MPKLKPPRNLRCEYQVNPLGLDTPAPRFSWVLDDSRPHARQAAYQLVSDNGWDSGRVRSDQSLHVPYAGPALKSRERVAWKVRTWDAQGKPSPWSAPAWRHTPGNDVSTATAKRLAILLASPGSAFCS